MAFQLHIILRTLSEFFDPELNLEDVEKIFSGNKSKRQRNEYDSNSDSDSDDDSSNNYNIDDVDSLEIVRRAKDDSKCFEVLSELISAAVQNRETPGIFFCQYDSWEFLSKHINTEHYLCFISCMVRLCGHDYSDKKNRKLSVLAARAYMVLLTTPGAKPHNVFNKEIIIKCLDIFNVMKTLRESIVNNDKVTGNDLIEFQIDLFNFMEVLKIVFGYVAIDSFVDIVVSAFSTMSLIIRDHFLNGFNSIYAYYMTVDAYKIMGIICTTSREETERTIMLAVNATCCLYVFTTPPKCEQGLQLPPASEDSSLFVTDFVQNLLNKQPTEVLKVMENFIKVVITRRDENFTESEYSKYLDAAVIYDSIMYKDYGITILAYMETSIVSSVAKHRMNTVLLAAKLLEHPNPKDNPIILTREITLIKMIMTSIIDIDNNVKTSALQSLLSTFERGNLKLRQIYECAFDRSSELDLDPEMFDSDVPSCAADISLSTSVDSDHDLSGRDKRNVSFEIKSIFPIRTIHIQNPNLKIDELVSVLSELLKNLLHLLENKSIHIRILALEILEKLVIRNRQCLDNTHFYGYVTSVGEDSSPKVRKQLIVFVNQICDRYPNYDAAIKMYAEAIIDFLQDRDKQICSMAVESIKSKIFDCIKTYELSDSAVNKRPWLFFNVILCNDLRNRFLKRMEILVKHNVVNQKILNTVETHLSTSNATEAWTVTHLLSRNIKSRNPQYVISAFKDVVINPEIVRTEAYDLVFQVMNIWVETFDLATVQKLQDMIRDIIHSGSSDPHMTSNLYNFANKAHTLCHETIDMNWISEIYEEATSYILQHISQFLDDVKMDSRFAQKLYIFSESSSDLLSRPDTHVVDFLIGYMKRLAKKEIVVVLHQNSYEDKTCIVLIVLTRLLLRDSELAMDVVNTYIKVADLTEASYDISSNFAHVFRDLFVKYGILMDSVLKALAKQVRSDYKKIRHMALEFLAEIIMKDLTKINAYLLFHIFLGLVDDDRHISDLGKKLVLAYVEHRSTGMLRECFIDIIFIIHNHLDFNQYTFVAKSELKKNQTAYSWPSTDTEKSFILYSFILDVIDPIEGYKLFEWIKIINIEIVRPEFHSTKTGMLVMRDIIYCLRKFCLSQVIEEETQVFTRKKQKNEDNDASDDEEEKEMIRNFKLKETVEQMISNVPKFYENVNKFFPDFQQKLDRLMEAICLCFHEMIATSFWDPFQENLKKKIKIAKTVNSSDDHEKNERIRLVSYLIKKERDPLEAYLYRQC